MRSPPYGHPCQNHYVVNGDDEIHERIVATAPKVAAVIQGIHQRSPNAGVYVVNYLPILPETGNGCWPQVPLAWDGGHGADVRQDSAPPLADVCYAAVGWAVRVDSSIGAWAVAGVTRSST